jgi:hypothetical protein
MLSIWLLQVEAEAHQVGVESAVAVAVQVVCELETNPWSQETPTPLRSAVVVLVLPHLLALLELSEVTPCLVPSLRQVAETEKVLVVPHKPLALAGLVLVAVSAVMQTESTQEQEHLVKETTVAQAPTPHPTMAVVAVEVKVLSVVLVLVPLAVLAAQVKHPLFLEHP